MSPLSAGQDTPGAVRAPGTPRPSPARYLEEEDAKTEWGEEWRVRVRQLYPQAPSKAARAQG